MTRHSVDAGQSAEPGSASELAEAALQQASADPDEAFRLASRALGLAGGHDPGAESMAEQALGVIARRRNDVDRAVGHVERAVQIAAAAGLQLREAQARVCLSGLLGYRGETERALREADLAAPHLRGRNLALLQAQRAFLLQMRGELVGALEGYGRALAAFRRAGDDFNRAKVFANRGLVHSHLGDDRAGFADLLRAQALYAELGQERVAADVRLNLGYVAARRGDLPEALTWFDRADGYFRAHGGPDAMALFDRTEVLLAARLVSEARATAEGAVAQLAQGGSTAFLAEARLRLALAYLLSGDAAGARSQADQAARAFTIQRRPSFAAMARFASVQAAWAAGDRSVSVLTTARRTAAELEASGWAVAALEARLMAGTAAIGLGRMRVARTELERASAARRHGPGQLRSRAWHAQALLRLAGGDRRGAETALRAGMRVLDGHRAVLGATDLRAHASAHASELARLGLRLAIEDANAARVLCWAERWRAGSLQLRPVRPPDDAMLREDLSRLRAVVREMQDAAKAGRDTGALLAREALLEEAVQRRARQVRGSGLYRTTLIPPAATLRAALGDHCLVELVEDEGQLHAVVIAGGPPRLHRLGRTAAVEPELDSIRFALRRLALRHGSTASRRAAHGALAYAAKSLDDLLLGPLTAEIGDRPMVVVPTGALHAVPWSMLPSCAWRPVTVAPSAALWHQVVTSPGRSGPTVLVGGPGLPAAASEVHDLDRIHDGAQCLDGPRATVDAVTAALDGAEMAHIAAHGRFRADNPLFSCLELADGPLTVYDLEALRDAPATIVLSACDSGLSEVCAGDELMGLAAALFALGTRNLIASVVPVNDTAVRPLMARLHASLRAGLSPAAALVEARAGQGDDEEGLAASASFVCFGAG